MKKHDLFVYLLLLLSSVSYAQPALVPYRLNTKWGFADMTGKLVIPAKYDRVVKFQGPCTIVKQNGRSGLINSTGKVVLPLVYDNIMYTHWEQKLWFILITGEKQGLADQTGKLVLPVKYKEVVLEFDRGYAVTEDDTQVEIKPPVGTVQETTGSALQNGAGVGMPVSPAPGPHLVGSFTLNGKTGYLIQKGEGGYDSIPAMYEAIDVSNQYGDILWAKKDGLWGVIDKKNKIVFPFLYEEMGPGNVVYNLYAGKKNGKYGILKPNGEVLVPFEWDKIYFTDDFFWCIVNKDDKQGIIILDRSTPVFIPARYKTISDNHVLVVEYKGRQVRFFNVETEQEAGYVREDGMEYFKDAK